MELIIRPFQGRRLFWLIRGRCPRLFNSSAADVKAHHLDYCPDIALAKYPGR